MKRVFLFSLIFFVSHAIMKAQTYSPKEKDFLEKMGGSYECSGSVSGERVIIYEKRGSRQLIFWVPERTTNSKMILYNVVATPYQNEDGVMYVGKLKDGKIVSVNFIFSDLSILFSMKDESGKLLLNGSDFKLKSIQ